MVKRILIVLCAIIFVISCAIGAMFVDVDFITRFHQHMNSSQDVTPCIHDEGEFCTNLPIVSMTLPNGKPVLNKYFIEDIKTQLSKTEHTASSIVDGTMNVYDGDEVNHHLSDSPNLSTPINVRYRGNSSIKFDKKSFKVDFVNSDQSENKQMFIGMPKHDKWILNGPFLDKTLIRNYLCYNISGEIMPDTPEVRFCELFIDGEYQGIYLAMESIERSEDRINIAKYKDGDPFSSYILRIDRDFRQPTAINNFANYANKMPKNITSEVIYPPQSKLSPELQTYIEKDFSKFEKALYSFDYDDKTFGYQNLVDVNSFVDYFIINEFFKNYDAGLYSTYFYKDIRGEVSIGPVWDFNNSCDNFMDNQHGTTGFDLIYRVEYDMLFRDEKFVERVISRYKELRKGVLSEQYLTRYITESIEYLGDSIERNYDIWGYSFDSRVLDEKNRLSPLERNFTTYEQSVRQLSTFLIERGKWLDKNIEILQQHSHESKVKKFNH